MTERRRTFGPVVALGLVAGALAAYAGSRPWFVDPTADGPTPDPLDRIVDAGSSPLATPVALVLLASWGVVLVTRGRVRRAVAGLALLAALGVTATVVAGFVTLQDPVSEAVREASARFDDVGGSAAGPWFWVAAVAALASVVAAALAVAWCPQWPEMGSRYDAPGGSRDDVPAEEQSHLDLWKSMDQGRDPTA
jgi:uncharacterized membrane protein (TIGR02234 family)